MAVLNALKKGIWEASVLSNLPNLWGETERDMLVDFVDPLRWYTVNETAKILGFGRDKIIRLIESGELEALTMPERPKRRRGYKSRRIQGSDILSDRDGKFESALCNNRCGRSRCPGA